MPEQDDFPSKWAHTCQSKRVRVEVRVPNGATSLGDLFGFGDSTDYTWIEIPTTSVETYVTKGEAAQIQRASKVKFPTEWGDDGVTVNHNSPRQLIEGYSSEDTGAFTVARVSYQRSDGEWVYTHLGWAGGVGSASREGESKMWVYDFSELLTGVPITITFNNPTVWNALNKLYLGTNDGTPIPITNVVLMQPDTEEEYSILREPGQTDNISLDQIDTGHSPYTGLSIDAGVSGDLGEFDQTRIGTGTIPYGDMDEKSFQKNHDTLMDVYEWFEDKTQAKLSFEPDPSGEGVYLVADVVPERRTYMQNAVIEEEGGTLHEPVTVLENSALVETKPFNTVRLRGDVGRGILDRGKDLLGDGYSLISSTPPSNEFPVATAKCPPLVEAAGGTELAPEIIESSATTLDSAEAEAVTELRNLLNEMSEGSIRIKGTPTILPFDRVTAYETCNNQVEINQEPVEYEVEEVKHEQVAGGFYKCELSVSIWANDEQFEVTSEMIAVDETAADESEDESAVSALIPDLFGIGG